MTLNWKPRFSSLCSICRVIAGKQWRDQRALPEYVQPDRLLRREGDSQSNPTYDEALMSSAGAGGAIVAAIVDEVSDS